MGASDDRKNDVKGPLNGLMKGLEGIFGLVDDMIVSGENLRNISKEIDLPTQEKVKAQYDMSVKLGLNEAHTSGKSFVKNNQIKIEPNVDTYEEEKRYQIIILTSNIEQKDIEIYSKDNRIIFEARNSEVFYYKEITIPCIIDDSKLTWAYKNGVTEIAISKEM